MALLGLYFGPSDLLEPQASFDAIAGRLLVAPVTRTLVYTKIPDEVSQTLKLRARSGSWGTDSLLFWTSIMRIARAVRRVYAQAAEKDCF